MGFLVEVVGLAGPLCRLRAEAAWTGQRLKREVEQLAGVPPCEQRLLLGGSELLDHEEPRRLSPADSVLVTLVRKPKIVLAAAAAPAQWYALYAHEKGHRPGNPTELSQFAGNRGAYMPYTLARKVVQEFKGPQRARGLDRGPARRRACFGAPAHGLPLQDIRAVRAEQEAVEVRARYLVLGALAPGEVCPICQEEGGGGAVELLCGNRHRFHRSCIEEWFKGAERDRAGARRNRARCPVCRGEALGRSVPARRSGIFATRAAASTADASWGAGRSWLASS